MTIDEFFNGKGESRQIFEALSAVMKTLGRVTMKITKSQVAFRRQTAFAWAWMPEMYLHRKCAPLVLSIALRHRDGSPRWKEIVEPNPGRFMHHLELYSESEIDEDVCLWLQEAWAEA